MTTKRRLSLVRVAQIVERRERKTFAGEAIVGVACAEC